MKVFITLRYPYRAQTYEVECNSLDHAMRLLNPDIASLQEVNILLPAHAKVHDEACKCSCAPEAEPAPETVASEIVQRVQTLVKDIQTSQVVTEAREAIKTCKEEAETFIKRVRERLAK